MRFTSIAENCGEFVVRLEFCWFWYRAVLYIYCMVSEEFNFECVIRLSKSLRMTVCYQNHGRWIDQKRATYFNPDHGGRMVFRYVGVNLHYYTLSKCKRFGPKIIDMKIWKICKCYFSTNTAHLLAAGHFIRPIRPETFGSSSRFPYVPDIKHFYQRTISNNLNQNRQSVNINSKLQIKFSVKTCHF